MKTNLQEFVLQQDNSIFEVVICGRDQIALDQIDNLSIFFDEEFKKIPIDGVIFKIIVHQFSEEEKGYLFYTNCSGNTLICGEQSRANSFITVKMVLAIMIEIFHVHFRTGEHVYIPELEDDNWNDFIDIDRLLKEARRDDFK